MQSVDEFAHEAVHLNSSTQYCFNLCWMGLNMHRRKIVNKIIFEYNFILFKFE